MSELRILYYLAALVPALLYLAGTVYASRYDGFGAGYAGFVLIVPIYASFVLGGLGACLIVYSKRRGETVLGPVVATIVAGSVCLWFAGKSVALVFLRPYLIDLGLY